MKLRLLRPAMLLALLLGVSACGSKEEFDIEMTFKGLQYKSTAGLRVTDRESGIKMGPIEPRLTAGNPVDFTEIFPRRLSYGDAYELYIAPEDQPPHQDCTGGTNRDSAGHLSEIKVVITCALKTPNLTGAVSITPAVTGAALTGLKITNGSVPAFTAVAGSTAYGFNKITYGSTFGLIIVSNPTDNKTVCEFVPKLTTTGTLSADKRTYTGVMGDNDVVVDVVCKAP
jgi:hypothetical protein